MEKRLIKSKDRKIFGVCGGLGNYFDIDPTIVRIAFLIAFVTAGAGLLIYLACAIAMPSE